VAFFIRELLPALGTLAQVETLTRLPIMALGLLLLTLVFRWAVDIGGWLAGVLAAVLMAWDPTMIAHTQLNTTDAGVTLFIFATIFVAWKATRQATTGRLLLAGLCAGLAAASKHSGLVAFPLLGLMTIWGWLWQRISSLGSSNRRLRKLARWLWQGAVAGLLGLMTLWAIYGFEIGPLPGAPFVLPMPSHLRSLSTLFEQQERLAFLRGNLREGGWWWYYPYVFAIKTPLPLLLALFWACGNTLRRGWRAWMESLPLWSFPALYAVVAMRSGMHIGYRHLLPVLPFVYVWGGRWVAHCLTRPTGSRTQRWLRWATVAGLSIWYVVATWRVYPYTLAYFNELIGGPSHGYRHVVDSNVDWGQGYKALADTLENEGIETVNLSYWTWVNPQRYGVNHHPLPPAPLTDKLAFASFAPPPGIYAISATTLQGILLQDPNLYGWFQQQDPIAQPGYAINVYRVPSYADDPGWVAQCTAPVAPLPPEEIDRGFGERAERIAYFDCDSAWLYPAGGESAGWYVLHRSAVAIDNEWQTTHLEGARLSFEQRMAGQLPPFSIFERAGRAPGLPPERTEITVTRQEQPIDGSSWTFNGPLALKAITAQATEDGTLEIQTWWEVVQLPERSFSIMGHFGRGDQVVSVTDGLGVPLTELRQGDLLVQRHRYDPGSEADQGGLWFETGGYWRASMERWRVLIDDQEVDARVMVLDAWEGVNR
jgi:hypothetical protein